MGRFSAWEIAVVIILIVLIFGGRKLPELGRSLGKGITNFRDALKNPKPDSSADEASKDAKDSKDDPPAKS
jgi:sec-independent protein translocase protein TatA